MRSARHHIQLKQDKEFVVVSQGLPPSAPSFTLEEQLSDASQLACHLTGLESCLLECHPGSIQISADSISELARKSSRTTLEHYSHTTLELFRKSSTPSAALQCIFVRSRQHIHLPSIWLPLCIQASTPAPPESHKLFWGSLNYLSKQRKAPNRCVPKEEPRLLAALNFCWSNIPIFIWA